LWKGGNLIKCIQDAHNHLLQASNTRKNAPRFIQDQSSPAAHCIITKEREFH